jgi:DNA-binding transcriptional ArsR family regulator
MSTSDERLDVLLRALADPTRRKLLTMVTKQPGMTTADLARRTSAMTRWGVMKHLSILAEAGLIQSMPEGRNTRHYSEPLALEPLRSWLASRQG